jgi:hypothetical protein
MLKVWERIGTKFRGHAASVLLVTALVFGVGNATKAEAAEGSRAGAGSPPIYVMTNRRRKRPWWDFATWLPVPPPKSENPSIPHRDLPLWRSHEEFRRAAARRARPRASEHRPALAPLRPAAVVAAGLARLRRQPGDSGPALGRLERPPGHAPIARGRAVPADRSARPARHARPDRGLPRRYGDSPAGGLDRGPLRRGYLPDLVGAGSGVAATSSTRSHLRSCRSIRSPKSSKRCCMADCACRTASSWPAILSSFGPGSCSLSSRRSRCWV